jgi:hypothetical protein
VSEIVGSAGEALSRGDSGRAGRPCQRERTEACHGSRASDSVAALDAGLLRHHPFRGVTVWTPEGKLIGRIRLPEVCANVCFGGPKRNRLFMAASQSLYALYVNTQGAAPG